MYVSEKKNKCKNFHIYMDDDRLVLSEWLMGKDNQQYQKSIDAIFKRLHSFCGTQSDTFLFMVYSNDLIKWFKQMVLTFGLIKWFNQKV